MARLRLAVVSLLFRLVPALFQALTPQEGAGMRRIILALAATVLIAACAGPSKRTLALAYCDQGLSAQIAGKLDLAIKNYTRCIDA